MRRFSSSAFFALILIILIGALLTVFASRIIQVTILLRNAQHAREMGAPALAAQSLALAANTIPWRTGFWEQAGHYALEGGEADTAVEYFSKAAALERLSLAGYLALGDACLKSGDIDSAVKWWRSAQKAGIPDADVYTRLLSVHRQRAEYPAVLADLKALTELQPDNADWQYQLGLVLSATQPEEALPYLSQAAELDPAFGEQTAMLSQKIRIARMNEDPAFTLLEAGRALGALNEWGLAAEAFQRAAQIRPDYAEAWAYLGEARQQLPGAQAPGEGLAELERALHLDPTSLSAYLLLSLYWQRRGQLDQALAYLDQAATLHPDLPAVQTEIGRILALQGDLNAAQQAYQQAVALAPQDPAYHRLLAAFSLEHNYLLSEVGLPAARRALLLSPNDPTSLDMLGQILLGLDDTTSAKRFFERAIMQQPEFALAHLHLGLIYIEAGDTKAAFEKFNQVLSLAPGTTAADQAQRLLDNYSP
jgi:tetratricopeptide (TPR) repeat protein